MIKVAFFVQHMTTGGIENALINFVKILPPEKYEIIVYVISYTGEFIQKAENICRLCLIPMDEKVRESIPVGGIRVSVKNRMQEKNYGAAAKMAASYLLGSHKFSEMNVNFDSIPMLNDTYDIAVCYQMHSPFLIRYVAEKTSAIKKVGWMHNDFATTKYQIKKLQCYLDQYDFFFGNASQIVQEFIDIFPEYKNRTDIIHSVLDWSEMFKQSKAAIAYEFVQDHATLNLLTIARLENQKGIDWAIETCAILLKEEHPDFKWFIIGDGSERPELERRIEELSLGGHFILLGSKLNPYPYYANCDIYIQTSRHEGYATTITEASLFFKPIVTTNVSGVSEQLVDGQTGIVTGFTPQDIADGIQKAFDQSVRERIEIALRATGGNREDALAIFEKALRI